MDTSTAVQTDDRPDDAVDRTDGHTDQPEIETTSVQPGVAVVHRARLAALLALVAGVLTVAWFARALRGDSAWDWIWCAVLTAIAVVQVMVVRDSRAPLLLADDQGVRVRRGSTWNGLPWSDIDHVEVASSGTGLGSWLRDGRIVVHPRAAEDAEEVSPDTFAVPLARTTRVRVEGLTGHLVDDLDALASGRTPVLVVTRLQTAPDAEDVAPEPEPTEPIEPAGPTETDDATPMPTDTPVHVVADVEVVAVRGARGEDGVVLPQQATAEAHDEMRPVRLPPTAAPDVSPVSSYHPVQPAREPRPAARAEVRREKVRPVSAPVPAQRHTGETVVVARVDDLEPYTPRPAEEAVIGPAVAAARQRAKLSIDTLSERTRIRPHVLECIEVDDFTPCGGDFYARGHLRTLARVFGLDAGELIALYDERYARPEIEARQVFEAELATGIGGGMRATFSGPRWSVLAASVVALAVVWSVAHFFTDQPQEVVSPAPNVESAGLTHATPAEKPQTTLAPLGITAKGDSPQVVVRDKDGRILWSGKLADGQHQQVIGLAPFDVTASNGQAVQVSFLGKPRGTVGPSSAADSHTFG